LLEIEAALAKPDLSRNLSQHSEGGDVRLVSLDAFRGLIIAGMILVTDPGTYSAVYPQLMHAQWNGATATDMIFPSFLVIIGVAMTFSFASRIERGADRSQLLLHVFTRSVLLIFLGLLVNGFPEYNLHTIRIPGILQRIALCYFAGSLLYLAVSGKKDAKAESQSLRRGTVIGAVLAGLLVLYWVLLKGYPVPRFGAGRLDSLGNVAAYFDRKIFGVQHLWAYGLTPGYGVTFDPEGLLSTLPALATLLFGVLAGEWLRTNQTRGRKALMLAVAGVALVLVGLALSPLLPLNKKILTSTFAVFSGGVALLLFAGFYLVLDVKRWRRGVTPLLVFGTNAIFAFVVSSIITTLLDRWHLALGDGTLVKAHQWLYDEGFATWMQPIHASLAYALVIVLVNLAIVYPLYRKRIFLRV
jgi:predicted acyltransferase